MTVVRLQLPVRSPSPLIVPCTWRAPARTAAIELATAQPVSSWQWMPMIASSPKWRCTSATIASTSYGSEPPLVSHSTRWLAPFTTAASSTRRRELGVALVAVEEVLGVEQHPQAVARRRNSTESATIASPSSSVVLQRLE